MAKLLQMGAMIALASVGMLIGGSVGARAAGKAALVLAVEDYQKLPKSSVGVKRGAEIADALTALGYDVIYSANPSNAAARANLRDFAHKAENADVALAVLIGHGATWNGQTFYLPSNAEIGRAADLLSRGISVPNVIQIVSKAEAAGVFVLTTSPDLNPPVEGLDKRPQFAEAVGKNVFAVLPSSGRVPVSRIDAMSELAADSLAKALKNPDVSMADAARAGANGDNGSIIGTPGTMSLKRPVSRAPAVQNANLTSGPDLRAGARADADKRGASEANVKGEQMSPPSAELQRAQADVQRAQAEARKAQADADRAQAEAQKAIAEAERMKAEARQVQVLAVAPGPPASQAANEGQQTVDERQVGQRQRQRIQERLKDMGLYTGPIDAIMGPLTREAIMGYQKNRGASVSGYLTSDQYQALLDTAR